MSALTTTKQKIPRIPAGDRQCASYGPDMLQYLLPVTMLPDQPNKPQTLRYENDTRSLPRIWKAYNTEYSQPPELNAETIKTLQEADIIMIATLLPNYSPDYVESLLSYARPGSLKVLCPQGYLRHIAGDGLVVPREFVEAAALVPLFDLVIYSEEDHPQAFKLAQQWAQLADSAAMIIVTEGQRGASFVNKAGVQHVATQPLAPHEILDSVGCGDVFDAAVAYAYYQSHDLVQAVSAANEAAGRKLRTAATVQVS